MRCFACIDKYRCNAGEKKNFGHVIEIQWRRSLERVKLDGYGGFPCVLLKDVACIPRNLACRYSKFLRTDAVISFMSLSSSFS